jgi:hypothetical protein|tara:strand:- start:30810 stop:31640 length:831 start_codon:yes stop_codon:yes gene_type:complete
LRLPDFIHIGTGKSATTWLFSVLSRHSDIYLTPVKETNFFDLNYHRGIAWYGRFFDEAKNEAVVGEISHRYIHHRAAADRIKSDVGNVKIIVGLREPRDYCISDYLFTKRNGRFSGTLDEWCETGFDWETIAYQTMLEPFLSTFGKDHLCVYRFDDLSANPQNVLNRITDHLAVSRHILSDAEHSPVNTAARPRNVAIANLVNRSSKFVKRRGGQRLVAAIKYNLVVQRLLYRSVIQRPQISAKWSQEIIDYTRPHAKWVDDKLDVELVTSWKLGQ